ncbi:MAG: DUF5615 family PIN-like protein [Chloroflexi bacterium]|nr:DUF5615 family PIN-like protein [Chloroflexota bacterium]
MSELKLLLDEHVNPRLGRALKRRSRTVTIWQVGDPGAPGLSASDPDLLLWCEEHGYVLVTNNRASMPVHLRDHLAAGRHVPGILMLNPSLEMGETVEELTLICGASDSDEYVDQIRYLPLTI